MADDTRAKTLYLVDGTSQLFRAYFAIRGLSNPGGMPTGAVYGFTTMLRKLVGDEKPRYLAVAFDLPGPTFRHDRYADYKAHRPPAPEDLNVQFPYAKKVCEAFRIPVLELPGFEADDLIATYARLGREAGFDVVVVASDKDLLQLVDDRVTVLNPSKNVRLDAAGVEEFFGVPPGRVRDVLGLMGDAVDNIPGVPGVGEKTAIAMVAGYGGVDEVIGRAQRFVAAFEARDALLAVLEAVGKDDPLSESTARAASEAGESVAARLRDLLAVERDEAFRGRLDELGGALDRAALGRLPSRAGSEGRAVAKDLQELIRALKDIEKGSGRKAWQSVRDHAEEARLSRELATVDALVPVVFDAEALQTEPPDRERLTALFRELGFRRLLAEAEEAPAPAEVAAEAPARADYRTVLSRPDLETVVAACRSAGCFAVDTETDGVDPLRARLVGISLSSAPASGAYVPVGHDYLGVPEQLPLATVREVLGPLLADPAVGKIGQNLKYDLHVLRRHGLPVEGWRLDTMVAAFLLEPDRPTFNLDGLARDLLAYETIRYEDVAGSGARQSTLDRVDVARVTEYAAEDADVTLRLAEVLEPRLVEMGLDVLYREVDGPLLPVLARMEAYGIRVDVGRLAAMSAEMGEALDRARREIHALAGAPFNVDSPKQLREVLFERLGMKPGRRTAKSGVASTDASTLEDLAGEHEIARRILEYRELAKLKGTYVDALPELVNPETGRVHTSYHPTGAATGRLSSSDPNLQNIPARTPMGRRIRSAFVPAEGWVFLASDYSQVELRVLAHLSGDPELISAFRAGEDIHRRTAARIFGVDPALVTDEMRRRAKAVNFGVLYGMSEGRLAREQGISRADAKRFIEAYFERFRAVRAYIERVRDDARRTREVRTFFGRVRFFPDLSGRAGRAAEEAALRAAVNTTVQGTAADLMKMAMLRVDAALSGAGLRTRMLLQVHDELLLEAPEEELGRVEPLVRKLMEEVHPLEVPLLVDGKTGASWMDVT
ncbi:MAG: DNA polymerase I [Acidobacteriia bacterium]|nr:DNA polymerase I [Terriglobia bacterium]